MKKKHLLILALLLANTLVEAQVTIGSGKTPIAGALLMLDDGTTGTAGENAKKGLGLPRVELQAYDKLKMGANADDLTAKGGEHVGLVVYNIGKDKCDVAVPTTGLHVWDGGKWVGVNAAPPYEPTPPDVSSPIFQPNAYMVNTIGSASSVTIPVAKAFAVWEYWASEAGGKKLQPRTFSGALSTKVEWQEGMGQAGNANALIISGTPSLSSNSITDRTATIIVNTTGALGNAVVSLSDDNGVLWSWHIWVTDTPGTNTYTNTSAVTNVFMDRNLGATSATPAADGSIGLYYQWGRHTPIPGATKFAVPNNTTIVPVVNTAISSALATDGNGGQNALAYAIKSPLAFITNGSGSYDWYSTTRTQWDTRWTEQQKDVACPAIVYDLPSITNPCPAGWKVPVGTNNHADSPWAGITLANAGTWNNGYNWTAPEAPVGFYPAAGQIDDGNGIMVYLNRDGYFWSGSPMDHVGYNMDFTNGYVNPWRTSYRACGISVRCVHE